MNPLEQETAVQSIAGRVLRLANLERDAVLILEDPEVKRAVAGFAHVEIHSSVCAVVPTADAERIYSELVARKGAAK